MNNTLLNIDWQQIFLHLFNFSILFGGLYILLYKPVKDFMKKRKEHYENMVSDAEAGRKLTEELKEKYSEKLKLADEEIRKKKEEAATEIDLQNKLRLEEGAKQAEAIVSKARETAERERERILSQVNKEIAALIVETIEKFLLECEGDSYEQFLNIAEGVDSNE